MKSSYLQIALIIAVTLSLSMIYLDMTALSVALPSMQKALNATREEIQWSVNIYLMVGAILAFASGRISDIFSHRKTFIFGLSFFSLASLGCGLSLNIDFLLLFRCLQAIGGVFVIVSCMSLIAIGFPENQRGKVIGVISSFSLAAMAVGPFIGGLIIKYLSWHWIFFVNIIFGLISLWPALKLKNDEPKSTIRAQFDWIGFFLSAIFTLNLTLAFSYSTSWGWLSPKFIAVLTSGIIAFFLFLLVESKKKEPLIDLKLFTLPNFLPGCLIASLVQIVIFLIVFVGVFLQNALGYSPFIAGLLLVPMTILSVLFANVGGYFADKFGPRLPVIVGTGIIALGTILTLLFFMNLSYYVLLPLLIGSGIGMSMINNPVRTAMLNQSPKNKYGMTNSIFSGMRQIVGTIGFAIIGTIITNIEYIQAKANLSKLIPTISSTEVGALLGLLSHTSASKAYLVKFNTHTQTIIKHIILTSYINSFFWALAFVGFLMIISFFLSIIFLKK